MSKQMWCNVIYSYKIPFAIAQLTIGPRFIWF